MNAIASQSMSRSSRKSRFMRAVTKAFNPVFAPMAARGWIGIWGQITHVGRKSGTTYRTPIAVLASGDDLIVPIPFGVGTQWTQNVLAAGEAQIRWKGRDRRVVEPRVVEFGEIRSRIHNPIRSIVPLIGIRHFLVARRVDA
jgi:deazaflavin-dependent oxidoreductase (nitroreductase family)